MVICRIIDVEERAALLAALDGNAYLVRLSGPPHAILQHSQNACHARGMHSRNHAVTQVSAGGSLANTMMALARLGLADHKLRGHSPPRIGMLSVSGNDLQVFAPHKHEICQFCLHGGIATPPHQGTSVFLGTVPWPWRSFLQKHMTVR